jgi:cytochrome P450
MHTSKYVFAPLNHAVNHISKGRGQMQKWASFNPGQKAFHIQNAPDDIHARQRKILSHAFSDRAVSHLFAKAAV